MTAANVPFRSGSAKPRGKAEPNAKAKAKAAKAAEVATRILAVLDAMRSLGPSSYPTKVGRLLELAEEPAALAKEILGKTFAGGVLAKLTPAGKGTAQAKQLATEVLRLEDLHGHAASDAVLVGLLGALRQQTGATCFGAAELAKAAPKELGAAFAASLADRIASGRLPEGVGMLRRKVSKKIETLLFLVTDVRPEVAAKRASVPSEGEARRRAPAAFQEAFESAFARLDRASGERNMVTLRALREALPDFERAAFEAGLAELRRARSFTLESSDGRHVRLAPEDLEAGIREGTSLYVYAARRNR